MSFTHVPFALNIPEMRSAPISTGIVVHGGAMCGLREMTDPEPDLRRLMCISRAADPLPTRPAGMVELAANVQKYGQLLNVTGFILHSATHLVQVLEGPTTAISSFYTTISQDRRHTDCTVILDMIVDCRSFTDCFLKIADISTLTLHPLICQLFDQLTTCFLGMWSYLPKEAALLLLRGRVPMEEHPQPLRLVVAFVHITQYREMLRNECLRAHLTDLLTCFTDVCEKHVHGSGGRIAKFINGCCMAYWPLSCAARAVCGITDLLQALGERRAKEPAGSALRLLYATAGLHCGRALLCNAGTSIADLTLLGDTVNACARVASLAPKLQRSFLVTASVVAVASHDLPMSLQPVGLHTLAGREQPMECYCVPGPAPDAEVLRQNVAAFGLRRRSDAARLALSVPDWKVTDMSCGGDEHTTDGASLAPEPVLAVPGSLDVDDISPHAVLSPDALTSPLTPPARTRPSERLITLTYVSHLPAPCLSTLQRVARKRNAAAGVTSCLLYLSGLVVQTLEGPEEAVVETWERIRRDPRHSGVVLVHRQPIEARTHCKPLSVEVVSKQGMDAFPLTVDVLAQLVQSFASLEVYTPSTVVQRMTCGGDPRMLQPRHADVLMIASDVCSFTLMSEAAPLEGVWHVCTTFTDLCTTAITNQGGEIVKLIGDCVMAYFPAGFALQALTAAQDIVHSCAQLRLQYRTSLDFRSLIHCGVGLDCGPVVMTHTGSQQMRDFALVGEVCMRVLETEAVSRAAGRAIIVSEAVAEQLPKEVGLSRLPGVHALHGKSTYAMGGQEWALQPAAIKRDIAAFRCADGEELQKSISCISSELLHTSIREASGASSTFRSPSPCRRASCSKVGGDGSGAMAMPLPNLKRCKGSLEFAPDVMPCSSPIQPPPLRPGIPAFATPPRRKALSRLFLCCVGRA